MLLVALYVSDDVLHDLVRWCPNPVMNNEMIQFAVLWMRRRSIVSYSHYVYPLPLLLAFGKSVLHMEALEVKKQKYVEYLFGPIQHWNTCRVQSMNSLFTNVIWLTDTGDISRWDTSNVENMSFMFRGCQHLKADLNRWNVSKVVCMSYMFSESDFNGALDQWNVSNVTNMDLMFEYCSEFRQPLTMWNVSKVKSARWFFGFVHTKQSLLPCWNWNTPHW